jgi:hypothetical protein
MDAKSAISEAQGKILDRLAECENAAGYLYDRFAEQFEKHAVFWSGMANEERQHATLLLSLHKTLDQGHLFFHIGRFSDDRIDTFLKMVRSEVRTLKSGRVSELQAFRTALRVEATLLESGFYECVESDAPAFQHLARAMVERTEEHQERIRDLIFSIRQDKTWDA